MGLGSSLGNLMDMALGLSGYTNPGIRTSDPSQVVSLLSNSSNGKSNNSELFDASSYFYNSELLNLLYSWELTTVIIDVYKSSLFDIISPSDLLVTGTEYDDKINKFLRDIGLKDKIIDNLYDSLYYGQYIFYIDYKNHKIRDVINPNNFVLCKKLGENYKFDLFDESDNISTDDLNRLIPFEDMGSIIFNPKLIQSVNINNEKVSNNEYLNSKIIDLTYWKGQSVVKNILWLLFEHFLKSLLRLLLTLKNSTRPDLLQAQIQNSKTPEINIAQAINDIESLLNNGEYTFDLRVSNPLAIISTIYNSIQNSVKVVPGLSNFTNFDLIQQPALNEKIQQLNDDINNQRQKIIQDSGIPEELLGGSSNRWEVISRSSRFQSYINSLLGSITVCIKHIVVNYIKKNYNKTLSLDSFDINIDSNNYLSNTVFINKMNSVTELFGKLNEALGSIDQLSSHNVVNKKVAINYLIGVLESVDKDLVGIVDKKKLSSSNSESESGSDSSFRFG